MKLYISPTSPYSRICLARALQLGLDDLPMQLVDPWQNPPELEAVNPLSQIPVLLLNDGSVITGTLSICQYLENQLPTPRYLSGTSQALALLDMLAQVVKLVRFKAPDSEDHPLVARGLAALQRALPRVAAFDGSSDKWPDVMLALVLLTIKLRRPDVYEAAARDDTRAAVEVFAARPLAEKTRPEALATTGAQTVGAR